MRYFNDIIIHCSGTRVDRPVTAASIKRWHVEGSRWKDIGYHFVIEIDDAFKEYN